MSHLIKVLGTATYEAQWIHGTSLIRLTARGILPCANYFAALEQRPERIIPPMWTMCFYVEPMCLRALKSFEETVTMVGHASTTHVRVHDATGEHEVPVQAAQAGTKTEAIALRDVKPHYSVYARVPVSETENIDCILVPEGSMVIATHAKVFGPASRKKCEAYMFDQCKPDKKVKAERGGEIPWPRVDAMARTKQGSAAAGQYQSIMSVESVSYLLNKKLPPDLVINATGHTSTADWTEPQLQPYLYIQPPKDGIQDFDFTAKAPGNGAAEVISKITASATLADVDLLNYWGQDKPLLGIRVHASNGSVETLFGKSTKKGNAKKKKT